MPTVRQFTALGVEKLKLPKGKVQVTYYERMERGVSLILIVGSTAKTWRCLTYEKGGRARSHKLGRFPQMKPDEARKLAREYFADPEKADAQAEAGTFKTVAENWIKRHVEPKGLRSQGEIERMLKTYVYPDRRDDDQGKRKGALRLHGWQDRPFLEIRRRDVNELLDDIADHNGPGMADAVLALIRGIMSWYQRRDEDYTSPIVPGMKRNHAGARTRILDDDEIRTVWAAAEKAGAYGAIVRFALLTAQRKAKLSTIQWADVKDGVWTMAAEAREKATAGVLVLPDEAVAIIEAQERKDKNPFVFAGRGKVAFNAWSQGKAELEELLPADMQPWTIHDLRRTAKSLMSRAGIRPDISERVLGHAIAGVEGVYDRHSYKDEKALALKALAALIGSILSPPADNVTALRRSA